MERSPSVAQKLYIPPPKVEEAVHLNRTPISAISADPLLRNGEHRANYPPPVSHWPAKSPGGPSPPPESSPLDYYVKDDKWTNERLTMDKSQVSIESSLDQLNTDAPQRRFMYGCIPVNRRSRWICLSVFGVILIILGVLGFLFFPRSPEFDVISVDKASDNSYTLADFDSTNPDKFKFSMDMIMKISVMNSNRYDIAVDNIDLKVCFKFSLTFQLFVKANASEINKAIPSPGQTVFTGATETQRIWVTDQNNLQSIGTGVHPKVVFPAGKTKELIMPLKIAYSPNPKFGAVNDPALNEIIQLCVSSDPKIDTDRRTVIYYEATNTIKSLSWIGFSPVLKNEAKIRCPFQGKKKPSDISVGKSRLDFINAITGK
jgi:hypothetical protein